MTTSPGVTVKRATLEKLELAVAEKKRSNAQRAADEAYESRRADNPRFGGRCTPEQKAQLTKLKKQHNCDEKTLIFRAVDFFEKNFKG